MDNYCGGCFQVIVGDATAAMSKHYHPNCFKCITCAQKLTGEYYEQGGLPYCRKDFEKINLHLCGICNKFIEGIMIDDKEGNYYHDNCFVCDMCKGSVVDGYFYIGGRRHCAHCKVKVNVENAPVMKDLGHCSGCYKRFDSTEVFSTVKALRYHHNCLKCYYCKKPINIDRDKYEYEQTTNILLNFCCQSCLTAKRADRCYECKTIIVVNPATTAFGRDYHTKCFKCSRCARGIPTAEAYAKIDDHPVCNICIPSK